MRSEFIDGLCSQAAVDERIVLLTADLGFGVLNTFSRRFPSRFINVGVAEQSMIGIATGLAESGLIPYCYSIASFAVARTLEFLRNGPILHSLPVRLVGVGPGMDYAFDGFTHYAPDDTGLLYGQPNCLQIAPFSAERARQWGMTSIDFQGLVYFRLSRTAPLIPVPEMHSLDGDLSRADCLVVSYGDCLGQAISLADAIVSETGVEVRCHPVEEFSSATVGALASTVARSGARVVVVLENHYIRGGFGTALVDELSSSNRNVRVIKWGIEEAPLVLLGGPAYLESSSFTSSADTLRRVREALVEVTYR